MVKMARHAATDRTQDTFKLPGIHLHNRVANPPSDFRRVDRSPAERRKTQSLPPPRQNGYLVTEQPATNDGVTYYEQGRPARGNDSRRQQSLPGKRGEAGGKHRHVNSAPSRKQRAQSQGAPLPKLNTLVAKSRGPAGGNDHVVTTSFAGYSTKDHDASPVRSTRFASTWAQVRAENHIEICATTSPDSTPRKPGNDETKSRDKSPNEKPAARTRQAKDASPNRDHTKGNKSRYNPEFSFHAPVRDKENVTPETTKKQPVSPTMKKKTGPPKHRSRDGKEKQIRFEGVENGHEEADRQEGEKDGQQSRDGQTTATRVTKTHQRKPWNNRLALTVPPEPKPAVKSWRRYEAELTHKPAVTSKKQVYKAYTGQFKQQLRDRELAEDDDEELSELRPSTKGSHDAEVDEQRPSPSNEYVLSKNEVAMYIHLQNVYGSEAFREQRKEWFFKKLSEVQIQELKQQAADKRLRDRKREESKKRQYRQLMYVRRKFRKEQLHRFRTQYVTSRVLEHEKADRYVYGLPDESDWEDEFGSFGASDKVSGSKSSSEETDSRQGKSSNKTTEKDNNQSTADSKARPIQEDKSSQNHVSKGTVKSGAQKSNGAGNVKTEHTPESPNVKHKSNDKVPEPTHAVSNNPNHVNNKSLPPSKIGKSNLSSVGKKDSKQTPVNSQTDRSKPPTRKNTTNTNQSDETHISNTETDDDQSKTQSNADMAEPKQTDESVNTTKEADSTRQPAIDKDTTMSNPSHVNGADTIPVKQLPQTSTSGKPDKSQSYHATDDIQSSSQKTFEHSPQKISQDTTKSKPINSKGQPDSLKQTSSESETLTKDQDKKKESKTIQSKPERADKSDNKTSTKTDKHSSVKQTQDNDPKDNKTQNKDKVSQKANSTSDDGLDKTDSKTTSENTSVSKTNSVANPGKADDSPSKSKSVESGDKKRTVTTKDSGGRYFTTTKNYGPQDAAPKPSDRQVNGHASESVNTPSKQISNTAPSQGEPTSQASQVKHPVSRPSDSRGRKKAPPKTEAEQKKQLQRKYGKMFDVNAGPTWNPGAKTPKMEGIDTVLIKVTDEKGRTRLKKREVKDVVKEAKAQLAVPDPDTPKRPASKGKGPAQDQANTIRPASADTLDFDDDEEEEEDVFERVRRKYNLQIDSDDDSIA